MLKGKRRMEWIKKHRLEFKTVDEIQEEVFRSIRERFARQYGKQPVVSIIVVARNEEKNVLSCLSSLSEQKCKYPYEVIVCNNNSADRTQEIIDRCGVKSILQPVAGIGYAREAGMWLAQGKYHLCANGDSIYPETWAEEMIGPLERGEAICTVGTFDRFGSALAPAGSLSWTSLADKARVFWNALRRPEKIASGSSMAFFTPMGLQVGWRKDVAADEDKLMAAAMKAYGQVRFIGSRTARVCKLPMSEVTTSPEPVSTVDRSTHVKENPKASLQESFEIILN